MSLANLELHRILFFYRKTKFQNQPSVKVSISDEYVFLKKKKSQKFPLLPKFVDENSKLDLTAKVKID